MPSAWEREVDVSVLAAYASGEYYPVILVYVDWPSGIVRANTNQDAITWGGNSWQGVGAFGEISLPSEGIGDIVSASGSMSIYGPINELQSASEEKIRNRRVRVYCGVTTERNGTTLTGNPWLAFDGYMDGSSIPFTRSDDKIYHSLRLTLGTGPSARSIASISHTNESQQKAYPNDTAGRHIINARKTAIKRTFPAS